MPSEKDVEYHKKYAFLKFHPSNSKNNKANGKHCLACSPQALYKQLAGNWKFIDPCSLTMGNSQLCQTIYE